MKLVAKCISIGFILLSLSACVTAPTNSRQNVGLLNISSSQYSKAYITSSRHQPRLVYTYQHGNCITHDRPRPVYTPYRYTQDAFTYQNYKRPCF